MKRGRILREAKVPVIIRRADGAIATVTLAQLCANVWIEDDAYVAILAGAAVTIKGTDDSESITIEIQETP